MTSTLKGAEDMLKLFERYFKIKDELALIEIKVKKLGFKSVEECVVFITLSENSEGMTKLQILDQTKISVGTFGTLILRLMKNNLVESTADKTDKSKNILRRQVYTLTQSGLDMIAQVKKALS